MTIQVHLTNGTDPWTVVSAIGTAVAALGAVGAVWFALRESARQRTAEATRAHREQAELISAWYSGIRRIEVNENIMEDGIAINLNNGSGQLVYDVVVFHVWLQGAAPHTGEAWLTPQMKQHSMDEFVVLGALEPGRSSVKLPYKGGPMQGRSGAEIGFTDRGGAHWIRRANGSLVEIKANAIDHYGVGRPVDYRNAKPPYVDPRPT